MSAVSSGVTIKVDEPAIFMAIQRDVLLLYWRSNPTVDSISKARQVLAEAARGGQKFHQITLVNKNAGMVPDGSDARRLMEAVLKENQKNYAMAVIVIEDQVFFAATIRAMLAGLQLVLRPPYPVKIVGSHPDAVAQLGAHGRGAEARALLASA